MASSATSQQEPRFAVDAAVGLVAQATNLGFVLKENADC
jgi:hypothetical protein